MNLDDIYLFVKVVDVGSFTAAAKLLHMPKSTLSRRLVKLEQGLSVKLLQRNTRSLHMTELGQTFYQQAKKSIFSLEQVWQTLQSEQQTLQGALRISVPLEMAGPPLADMFDRFLQQYPGVSLDLNISDNLVNVIDESYDLVIRAGKLKDSSLVARKLKTIELQVFASQDYIKRCGTVVHPQDLDQHQCIVKSSEGTKPVWRFRRGRETSTIAVQSRYRVNNPQIYLQWVLAGKGLGVLPVSSAEPYLVDNRLVNVMPQWRLGSIDLYLLYPSRQYMPQKVKVLKDYIRDWFENSF